MRFFGRDIGPIHAEFPRTSEILRRSPFTSAGFYAMQPTSQLHPHRGVHSGILRYHLGLIIPDEGNKFVLCDMLPGKHRPDELKLDAADCKNGDRFHEYHLDEGADWVFDDTDVHYATTAESDTDRVIFLADFPRPNLPWWLRWLNATSLRFWLKRIPSVAKYPDAYTQHYLRLAAMPVSDPLPEYQCAMADLNDSDRYTKKMLATESHRRSKVGRGSGSLRGAGLLGPSD